MSAARWLARRAAATPRALAVADADERLDFAELASRAADAAACLRGAGIAPGDTLALLLPNRLAFAVAVHAAARAGARLLVLNARLTAAELAPQLRRAGAALLLHDPALETPAAAAAAAAGVARRAVAPVGCPLCGSARAHAAPPPPAPASLDDTLAVLFTSGTRGPAKGVPLSHGNFGWSAHASALRLGARSDDVWLACLPLFHVGGLSILLRSAIHGFGVRLHERFDPERVSAELDAGEASLLSLVPTMLTRLLEVRRRPAPPRLRAVLLGGAPASPALLERARKAGFPVRPTYGLTEATSQVATTLAAAPDGPGVGPPLFGTAVRIRDAEGRPLPVGAEGEIEVRGPTLMRGYLDDPEADRAAFREDGWLRTGDLGRLDPQGGLQVLARRDDVIVSGGENVHPAEVEAALLDHPEVAEAGVAGLPDPDLGQRVAAWVVARPGARPDPEALRAGCRERLAGYKVPRRVFLVETLPRNAAGKLQRGRLAQPDSP